MLHLRQHHIVNSILHVHYGLMSIIGIVHNCVGMAQKQDSGSYQCISIYTVISYHWGTST